jgi:hypothetical protein
MLSTMVKLADKQKLVYLKLQTMHRVDRYRRTNSY